MIRSYQTFACAMLGMVLMVFIERGLEPYLFLALALSVPWDKLARMTGELAERFMERRANPAEEAVPKPELNLADSCDEQGEA